MEDFTPLISSRAVADLGLKSSQYDTAADGSGGDIVDNYLAFAVDRAITWKYNRFAQALDIAYSFCVEKSSPAAMASGSGVSVFSPTRVKLQVANASAKTAEPFYPENSTEDFALYLLSKTPQQHARELVSRLLKLTPYVSIMSFVYGREQVISVENERLVHISMLITGDDETSATTAANAGTIAARVDWPLSSGQADALIHLAHPLFTYLVRSKRWYHPESIEDTSMAEEAMVVLRNMAGLESSSTARAPSSARHRSGGLHTHVLTISDLHMHNVGTSEDLVDGGRQRHDPSQKRPSTHHANHSASVLSSLHSVMHRCCLDACVANTRTALYCGKSHANVDMVSAVGSVDFAKAFIAAVVKELASKGIPKVRGWFVINKNFIMEDFRLKRVNVFLEAPGSQRVHALSVFNSNDYELLPSVSATQRGSSEGAAGLQIQAHPYVEFRFLVYGIIMKKFFGASANAPRPKHGRGDGRDIFSGVDYESMISLLARGINISQGSQFSSGDVKWIGTIRDDKVDKVKMGINVWRPPSTKIQ
jgi:hypothetical protein